MFLQKFLSTHLRYYINNICVLMLSFVLFACSSGQSVILNNVSQDSLNDVLIVLVDNFITAKTELRKDGSYTVSVDNSQKLKALNILSKNGLPKKTYVGLGDVFKKDSLISSPLEEYNRNIYAIDQEISEMLSSLNGVISVHTKVAMPKPNDKLWQSEVPKPTASVLIIFKQGARIDLYTNKIKSLVSHSVEGLIPEQVEVVSMQQRDF